MLFGRTNHNYWHAREYINRWRAFYFFNLNQTDKLKNDKLVILMIRDSSIVFCFIFVANYKLKL